jgi:hypothetical protein
MLRRADAVAHAFMIKYPLGYWSFVILLHACNLDSHCVQYWVVVFTLRAPPPVAEGLAHAGVSSWLSVTSPLYPSGKKRRGARLKNCATLFTSSLVLQLMFAMNRREHLPLRLLRHRSSFVG